MALKMPEWRVVDFETALMAQNLDPNRRCYYHPSDFTDIRDEV